MRIITQLHSAYAWLQIWYATNKTCNNYMKSVIVIIIKIKHNILKMKQKNLDGCDNEKRNNDE